MVQPDRVRGEGRMGSLLGENLPETRQLDGLAVINRAFEFGGPQIDTDEDHAISGTTSRRGT